jgi:shikimate kinase
MKHLILIGFKHVGKSAIAKELASRLNLPLVDVDAEVEQTFRQTTGEIATCRQIVQTRGEPVFRELESQALKVVLQRPERSIVSLGGGAVMDPGNQKLISQYQVIHVTAPKGIVYERIMVHGKPAFFPKNEEPFTAFNRIWQERETIYQRFAALTVVNDKSITDAVNQIINSPELALKPLK